MLSTSTQGMRAGTCQADFCRLGIWPAESRPEFPKSCQLWIDDDTVDVDTKAHTDSAAREKDEKVPATRPVYDDVLVDDSDVIFVSSVAKRPSPLDGGNARKKIKAEDVGTLSNSVKTEGSSIKDFFAKKTSHDRGP
ncbi:hypothetical protein LZ554_000673 [Drepanopeziza brunnea f. sp. 'monogermtubi']|nr:hypothetical protein LZ554_000673 [Drepanopeziza brunnea f. sp. 'monogermtubi']